MTLANRLNASNITPVIALGNTNGDTISFTELGLTELGCYAQYPLSDAKVYVRDQNGEEACWNEDWYTP